MTTQINTKIASNILIVDDNLDNLRLLSDMLMQQGYKIRKAISGNLAIQALTAMEFDLILLDITMPDMDGYEVCRNIKENANFAHIPIIFISALNDVLDKVKAFQVGGVDYITKPFQIEEVTARVENQLQIINLQKELRTLNQQLIKNNQQLQQTNDRFVQNSLIDPITNFKTKISFMGQLRQKLKLYSDSNNFFAFLIIQCDRLKLYKTILMAEAESKCLLYISSNIKKFVPDSSILGRLNETEFAVFIENINVKNIDNIIGTIEEIQQQLKSPFSIDEQEFFLNPSCGIVIGDKKYQYPEQILYDARHALFYAQTQGYSNYQIFDDEIQLQTLINSELKLNFIKALSEQNLKINYQPIISLATKKLSGLEANVIWYPPASNTAISLEKLGGLAAETGCIDLLNQWLFKEVCRQVRKYQKVLLEQKNSTLDILESVFSIRINLSSSQFLQSDLPAEIDKILQNFKINKENIVLIVSEKALIDNPTIAIKNIKNLQQLSIKIIINNLGTHYLSLIKEHNFSIDQLKLNGSLLQKLEANQQNRTICSAMITTARCLGMTLTVEGIQTSQQLDYLTKLGCTFGQGYFISQLMQPQLKQMNFL